MSLWNEIEIPGIARQGAITTTEAAPVSITLASGEELKASERKELIEKSRAGEHIELKVSAVTYIQRETPNRNYIRFSDKVTALRRIAKTGKGTPFLRDHSQRSQSDRGGTMLSSKAEKLEDGSIAFVQEILVSTPWAVQGVLDGTIDRFSIGWQPTGPLVYRHSGEEVERYPAHWPGEELEDGTIVEWVFTDAQLVETSAVNVPAVLGTEITQKVRAALSAGSIRETGDRNSPAQEGTDMLNRVKTILGLSLAAGDVDIERALEDIKAKAAKTDDVEHKLKAAQAQLKLELAKALDEKLERDIDEAIQDGRLSLKRNKDGERIPSATETALRGIAETLGYEAFREQLDKLSKGSSPVNYRARAHSKPESDPDPDVEIDSDDDPSKLARKNPHLAEVAKKLGRSVDEMVDGARLDEIPESWTH